jgi:hypothetical protein
MTVYVIRSQCGRLKIGYTEAATADDRLRGMQTGSPRALECVAAFAGSRSTEQWLHAVFRKSRTHGEWFDPSPLFGSLLAYFERFGHIDGWEEAELRPGLWADAGAPTTKSRLKTVRELVEREHRWTRALKKTHAEVDRGTVAAIEAAWKPVALRIEDEAAGEFLDSDEVVWSGQGEARGAGVGITATALRHCAVPCWVWLGAFLHDLNRQGSLFLSEVLHRPGRLVRLIRAKCPVTWHHLSPALPQRVWLPAHCRLSHDEFLVACQQTARLMALDWTVRFVWRSGSTQRLPRAA